MDRVGDRFEVQGAVDRDDRNGQGSVDADHQRFEYLLRWHTNGLRCFKPIPKVAAWVVLIGVSCVRDAC